ncbi:hypothetical protein RF11_16212 [Thelohanellus kitauei]|uniref:Uncharacterized protein n=1 Tax=Thelohanellus kitauei TaxID=669202 RepID=A0A0C2IB07_THEKT|nr:hypothetical protein RF11_16212 [Thelohanellus kitauei]
MYSKAAELAELELIDYNRASRNYLEAAICFCYVSTDSACAYFKKSIRAFINSEDIDSAIYLSMICGYMYETKFGTCSRSLKFYMISHKLRIKNQKNHKCIITYDDYMAMEKTNGLEFVKWRQIIRSNKRICKKKNKPLDICLKCIYAHAKLDEDFEESIYFQDPYKYSFKKRKPFPKIKYIMNNIAGLNDKKQHSAVSSDSGIYSNTETNSTQ